MLKIFLCHQDTLFLDMENICSFWLEVLERYDYLPYGLLQQTLFMILSKSLLSIKHNVQNGFLKSKPLLRTVSKMSLSAKDELATKPFFESSCNNHRDPCKNIRLLSKISNVFKTMMTIRLNIYNIH